MKLLLVLTVAVLAVVAFAERKTISVQPIGIETYTFTNAWNMGLTTHKDLMMYTDYSGEVDVLVIRRRNADGVYEPVANFTTDFRNTYSATNGKLIAILPPSRLTAATLFSIDENNVLSNPTTLSVFGGFMLSDDTFVAYDVRSRSGNLLVRTYQYQASSNSWNNIPGTEVKVDNIPYFAGDYSSYRANDKNLIFSFNSPNNITVQIYERNANKSWSLTDSVPVNSSFGQAPNVLYNGVDTLFCSYPIWRASDNSMGIAFLYTKVDGVWTETTLQLTDLGLTPIGLFGYSAHFVNTDTLLINAAFDGLTDVNQPVGQNGKILAMTRNDRGIWQPSIEFISNGTGLFSFGMAVNDHDVIGVSLTSMNLTYGYPVAFYSTPVCFVAPPDVTCKNDQQVSDCSQLDATQLDISTLYTVNNPQCGAITASINGVSIINTRELEVQLSFTKDYVRNGTTYCNVTVTCPAPPVIAPAASVAPFTPVSSVPTVVPVIPVAPVAVVPPVTIVAPTQPVVVPVSVVAPVSNIQGTTTSTKVSSAGIMQFGLALVAAIVPLL